MQLERGKILKEKYSKIDEISIFKEKLVFEFTTKIVKPEVEECKITKVEKKICKIVGQYRFSTTR